MLETNESSSCAASFVFLWIVADNFDLQRFVIADDDLDGKISNLLMRNEFVVSLATSRPAARNKKIMYTYYDGKSTSIIDDSADSQAEASKLLMWLQRLHNDVNVVELAIGREYFELVRDVLDKSSFEMYGESLIEPQSNVELKMAII